MDGRFEVDAVVLTALTLGPKGEPEVSRERLLLPFFMAARPLPPPPPTVLPPPPPTEPLPPSSSSSSLSPSSDSSSDEEESDESAALRSVSMPGLLSTAARVEKSCQARRFRRTACTLRP